MVEMIVGGEVLEVVMMGSEEGVEKVGIVFVF